MIITRNVGWHDAVNGDYFLIFLSKRKIRDISANANHCKMISIIKINEDFIHSQEEIHRMDFVYPAQQNNEKYLHPQYANMLHLYSTNLIPFLQPKI